MRIASLITVVAILESIGCSGPSATSTATSSAPTSMSAPSSSSTTDSVSTTTGALPTETTAASSSPAPATPSPTAVPGEASSQPAADSATSSGLTATPNPPANQQVAPAADPLIDGIDNRTLTRSYESASKEVAAKPTDGVVQLKYINVLQSVGMEWMRNGSPDKGYQAFAKSADVARQLQAAKVALPAGAQEALGNVFYNDACASSRKEDTARALTALNEAVQFGFGDFGLMAEDEDLAAVRKLPEYTKMLALWKKSAQEQLLKRVQEELAAGEKFPFDFALTDIEGKDIKLADYRGKVLIVDVWGTWCPPCRAEIPSFVKLQATYADRGFQMIGLNKESGEPDTAIKKVKAFIADNGMNYPCAMIDDETKDQIPDFQGYPTTLFIDRTGKVRMKVVGLHPYEYLEAVVVALLNESA